MDNKLKELVVIEANNLRHYVNKKEKDKLEFKKMNPSSRTSCLYSIVSDNYLSKRCLELLNSCSEPYSNHYVNYSKPKNKTFIMDVDRDYSAIEYYTNQKGAKNKELIDYIKGDIDTLEL